MKQVFKEPLLHFLVLGAVLFVVYSVMQKPGQGGEQGKILVTKGQIAHLANGFAQAWRRPPTPEEMAGLVRDRVREEVYAREAIAMGLDKDDTVIRRRLRQKLEFVSEDIVAQAEPTDADLHAYLQAHPEAFRVGPRISFSHVYLSPQRRGRTLKRDAEQLLAQLNRAGAKADASALGDSLMLERSFDALPRGEVAKLFGENFAEKLGGLAPGRWQGPVESGYGVHLVLVNERIEGGMPALAEARDAVRREWANARRLEANEALYQQLLKRYTVTIEGLEPEKLAVGK